jgi:hypothetical protein
MLSRGMLTRALLVVVYLEGKSEIRSLLVEVEVF